MARNPVTFARPLRLLKSLGAWPRRFFWPLIFIPSVFVFSTQIGFFFGGVPMDNTMVLQSARELIGILTTAGKSFFMCRMAHKVQKVHDFTELDLRQYETDLPPQAKEIDDKRSRFANKVCFWVSFSYICLFVSSTIQTFLSYFLDSRETRTAVISVGPQDIFIDTDIGFLSIAVGYSLHAYVAIVGTIAFDILYVVASNFISTKTMILSVMLKEVSADLKNMAVRHYSSFNAEFSMGTITEIEKDMPFSLQDRNQWSGRRVDEETIYSSIRRCIQYHQRICRLRDDLEDICSTLLLIAIGSIIVFLALPMVKILLFGVDDRGGFIFMGFIFVWGYFQLVYICYWGDQVLSKSEDVTDAAFDVYTAGFCSKRIRIALEMIITRAQKPLYLSAARLFRINYDTFIFAARKSYTVCAFGLEVK